MRTGKDGQIRRYGYRVVVVHWMFIVLIFSIIGTGLLLLRDVIYEELNVVGGLNLLPTPEGTVEMHAYLGLGIVILGYLHFMIHIGQRELPMVSDNVRRDGGAVLHGFFHFFRMAKRQERGSSEKYGANQRMAYLVTIYAIGLAAITALLLVLGILDGPGLMLHIAAGMVVVAIVVFRLFYIVRMHDLVAIKCILFTGKMPEGYVKKHYYHWYKKAKGWSQQQENDEGPAHEEPDETEPDGVSEEVTT